MLNFAPAQFSVFAEAFQAHVDQRMEDANLERPLHNSVELPGRGLVERPALGVGSVGVECTKALAYEFHRWPKDPGRNFSGKLLRVFARGHAAEAGMVEILAAAGFKILTQTKTGSQFRFDQAKYEDGKGRIKGFADGVVIAGPDGIEMSGGVMHVMLYPCLWENKEVNSKKWTKFLKGGVKAVEFKYYVQMQLLMGYLGLSEHPALFTAKNADTQEIYAELVHFDPAVAQQQSDRALRVVQSVSPDEFPRIASESTNFKCRFCDWHDRCWAAVPERAGPDFAPNWLSNMRESI
jgi:hypothetical protein